MCSFQYDRDVDHFFASMNDKYGGGVESTVRPSHDCCRTIKERHRSEAVHKAVQEIPSTSSYSSALSRMVSTTKSSQTLNGCMGGMSKHMLEKQNHDMSSSVAMEKSFGFEMWRNWNDRQIALHRGGGEGGDECAVGSNNPFAPISPADAWHKQPLSAPPVVGAAHSSSQAKLGGEVHQIRTNKNVNVSRVHGWQSNGLQHKADSRSSDPIPIPSSVHLNVYTECNDLKHISKDGRVECIGPNFDVSDLGGSSNAKGSCEAKECSENLYMNYYNSKAGGEAGGDSRASRIRVYKSPSDDKDCRIHVAADCKQPLAGARPLFDEKSTNCYQSFDDLSANINPICSPTDAPKPSRPYLRKHAASMSSCSIVSENPYFDAQVEDQGEVGVSDGYGYGRLDAREKHLRKLSTDIAVLVQKACEEYINASARK